MTKLCRRFVCGLLTLILLMPALSTVWAEEEAQSRVVRVVCGINNALYLDEQGTLRGYCSQYLRQMAWLKNWTLEYVECTWDEALKGAENHTIDLFLPVQMTDERKTILNYSDYIGGYEAIGLYTNEDSSVCFNEYKVLNQKRIGIEKSNICMQELAQFAEAHGLEYTQVIYDSSKDLIGALHNGDVDMIVVSTLNDVPQGKLVAVLNYLPFYYCTAAGDEELLSELNAGMREIMTDSPDMAVSVYDNVMRVTSQVGYTKEEKQVIADTKKLVVAMYDDELPLSGRGTDGSCIGIYVELLKEVEKITGIEMVPYLVSPDEFIFDYLDNGTADYVMCTNRLPYLSSHLSDYLGSDAITTYDTIAVTRLDENLEQMEKPVFALTTYRSYLEARILKAYPDAEFRYFTTAKDCMAAVQSRKADATFINTWEYNYQSKNARFRSMTAWENTRISSDLIVATTTEKNAEALAVVDKAFHQIASTDIDMIVATNINMPYTSYDSGDTWYDIWNGLRFYGVFFLPALFCFLLYFHMRRKNMRSLLEKNRELESANEAKTLFLSRMSHEMRTPLNAIAGYAQEQENNCLAGTHDTKAELKAATSILRAVRYQQAIIGDLLNIQRIESGKIKLVKEEVDAADYMSDIVDMIRPEAEAKGINFTYDRLTSTNETYLIDPVRLQQILFNLLHNAIKFTPSGGSVHMTAKAYAQEENKVFLEFVVSDTGIGMSKEFVATKLFQNFAQEHQGMTSPYEGCGIGLATCKELVQLMDGDITCESETGKGSTFTVRICAEGQKKKRRERRAREPIPCDLDGIRILLCEDNETNQEMEKRVLEKMGCTVEVAENGRIGCELFEKSTEGYYDIVLMDIRMPEMDGLEAARTIRAMQRTDAKKVPILAVSANAFDEDVKQSLAAGMNEHMAKPMDVRMVHEKIKMYCKK